MTSTASSEAPLDGVRGLVFFSFPLHQPGKPETKRADHLARVAVPMLFLSGTRDELADLELLRDQVSQMVAGRLHERVAREGEVAWTPGVRLSTKGVHFRRRQLLGKGEEALASFAEENL